jgi:hypothetical protein
MIAAGGPLDDLQPGVGIASRPSGMTSELAQSEDTVRLFATLVDMA